MLNTLRDKVLQQAAEKGFGTKPEEISVYEKIALIHSELSEAYEAFLRNDLNGKDGLYEELGDTLQRTLHLGGVYSVDFDSTTPDKTPTPEGIETTIARLHKVVSTALGHYRHKQEDRFKETLSLLAHELWRTAAHYQFSLEDAVLAKLERNKQRTWNPAEINERFTDT
ncbi:hypothetical protein HY642_01915 [Candidatus Woesearchaeota archaeon]|nr:hypothetical protein [Candidatus Woesearchaeota archaeon]